VFTSLRRGAGRSVWTVVAASSLTLAVAGTALPAAAGEAPVRSTAAASGSAVHGRYGVQDPTYDGVYRQGLALLALKAAGSRTQHAAVGWLLRQQCGNGAWTSYRGDLSQPCAAGQGDTNATAMAVMALAALGRTTPARAGLAWLRKVQRPDGGWYFSAQFGTTSDSNSTALALQAALALHVAPRTLVRNGRSGFDFLRARQRGCSAEPVHRGALGFTAADPQPNDFATAQALQALARARLPIRPARSWSAVPSLRCGPGAIRHTPVGGAAAYLAHRLKAFGGAIPSPGRGTDYGTTANAVLGLVAAGLGRKQVGAAMTTLRRHVRAYVLDSARNTYPAAAAVVSLAVEATGGNSRHVGGLDLVRRLRSSITP
jgi:hypothetical protein